ncbi:MAG: hypothetical protein DRJ09_08160 [Bacteroidetes bacterium]|nr:MAG: hypothetical protein DRJ09_08160 [Bacteroidota bacterium]
MKITPNNQALFTDLVNKSTLKQQVYQVTLKSFNNLKKVIEQYVSNYREFVKSDKKNPDILFESNDNGQFEIELKFGSDILIFIMHSNVFEFPRDHEVMKTSYVKKDPSRSYHGIINIYNFLADSFKYNRVNDIGYLIGRVFINKDGSFFIEGKRELSYLYNYYGSKKFDTDAMNELVEAAIRYTLNFDLLTPHYDLVKEVSVVEMKNAVDTISLKTGKRLGFRFQSDNQKI